MAQNNFESKMIFGSEKKFGPKKICGTEKNFGSEKDFRPEIFFLGPNKIFGLKIDRGQLVHLRYNLALLRTLQIIPDMTLSISESYFVLQISKSPNIA